MKKFLKAVLINAACLALLAEIFPGFQISERLKGLIIASLALTLANLILRPIIKTVLLPINLLTLGALNWLVNVINLALLTFFIPQMMIKSFPFKGINFEGIIIQPFKVSYLLSLVFASLLLTLIRKIILEIIKKPEDD